MLLDGRIQRIRRGFFGVHHRCFFDRRVRLVACFTLLCSVACWTRSGRCLLRSRRSDLDFVSFTLPRDENVADQQLLLPICWAGLGWLSSDASRRLWPGLLLVALSASSHGTYHSVGGRGWRWIRTIERLRWAGGHRGLVPWSCFAAFASGSEYGKFVLATLSVPLTFECQKSPGNLIYR